MDPVVIVGAGPTGLVLAMYLARRGLAVEVFERHDPAAAAARIPSASINLTICERGFAALRGIDLEFDVRRASVPAYGRRFHLRDGTTAYQAYNVCGTTRDALFAISRNGLTRLLARIAQQRYSLRPRFGQACIAVDPSRPAIWIEDRTTGNRSWMRASAIIGADGVFSKVRSSLSAQECVVDSLTSASMAYKQVDISTSGGWTEERDALHIWPRGSEMMLAIANPRTGFTAAVLFAAGTEDIVHLPANENELHAYFSTNYPDALEFMPTLGRDFFDRRAVPLVTVRCQPWNVGNVLLLGDAAHGVLPSYGQGANAGFEDAALLDECVDRHGQDLAAAFANFYEERRPDTDALADLSQQHLIDLRSSMSEPDWITRAEIEYALTQVATEYRQLYQTIAFTSIPYAVAVERDRRWAPLVEKLLDSPEIRRDPGSRDAEQLIREIAKMSGMIREPTA